MAADIGAKFDLTTTVQGFTFRDISSWKVAGTLKFLERKFTESEIKSRLKNVERV